MSERSKYYCFYIEKQSNNCLYCTYSFVMPEHFFFIIWNTVETIKRKIFFLFSLSDMKNRVNVSCGGDLLFVKAFASMYYVEHHSILSWNMCLRESDCPFYGRLLSMKHICRINGSLKPISSSYDLFILLNYWLHLLEAISHFKCWTSTQNLWHNLFFTSDFSSKSFVANIPEK